MKTHIYGLIRGLTLSLFAVAVLTAQEHPNGFYFTTPISLSVGNDNGFVVGDQKLKDNVGIVNLQAMSWLRNTHRTSLSLGYEPEFELFQRHDELDAWNHNGTFRLLHQIDSRFSVSAGDSFLSTMDASRALKNSLLLLPRGRFTQNSFYAGFGYQYDLATKFNFRFDNTVTTFGTPGLLGDRLDQTTGALTAEVNHEITSAHKITASYSYLRVHPFHPAVAGEPSNVHLISVGYDWDVNRGLILHLSGGALEGAESAVMGSAAIQKSLGGLWVAAGYQRYIPFFGGAFASVALPAGGVPFADGVTPVSVYQIASLRMWGHITNRLGIELNAQRALNGVDTRNRDIRSGLGQVRLDYRITHRLSLFARADYYNQNINQFLPTSISRGRYFAGLEITLFSPPVDERPLQLPEDSREPTRGIGATQLSHSDRGVGASQQEKGNEPK